MIRAGIWEIAQRQHEGERRTSKGCVRYGDGRMHGSRADVENDLGCSIAETAIYKGNREVRKDNPFRATKDDVLTLRFVLPPSSPP